MISTTMIYMEIKHNLKGDAATGRQPHEYDHREVRESR